MIKEIVEHPQQKKKTSKVLPINLNYFTSDNLPYEPNFFFHNISKKVSVY